VHQGTEWDVVEHTSLKETALEQDQRLFVALIRTFPV